MTLGEPIRSGRFAIVSTARFHQVPWFADPNPEVFPLRVRKMVTKNLALLRYPVDLSADPTSALAISASPPETLTDWALANFFSNPTRRSGGSGVLPSVSRLVQRSVNGRLKSDGCCPALHI
jgi:hypothetical protein